MVMGTVDMGWATVAMEEAMQEAMEDMEGVMAIHEVDMPMSRRVLEIWSTTTAEHQAVPPTAASSSSSPPSCPC